MFLVIKKTQVSRFQLQTTADSLRQRRASLELMDINDMVCQKGKDILKGEFFSAILSQVDILSQFGH